MRKAGNQRADHGAAREGGGRLPSLVGDLRPRARRHLRGAGRHRPLGVERAEGDAAGQARPATPRAERRGLQPRAPGAAPPEEARPRRTGGRPRFCWRTCSSATRTTRTPGSTSPSSTCADSSRRDTARGQARGPPRSSRQALERALALDPDMADAHALLARVHRMRWDFAGGGSVDEASAGAGAGQRRRDRRRGGSRVDFRTLRRGDRAPEAGPRDRSPERHRHATTSASGTSPPVGLPRPRRP